MAEVIFLENPIPCLRCEECGCEAFFIELGGENPYNIRGYTCADCGSSWDLLPLEQVFEDMLDAD